MIDSNPSSNNKRIAKNTLLLYFRMILIMIVTLYTSRVILDQLGIEDFGIYNVVGGVVLMFSFLNASMATSTQRFLTYEIGKGNKKRLSDIFSAALNIHIVIGIIVFVLAEIFGLWFLNTQMNIPADRIDAANWVFQFSMFTLFTNIIQVPYNASLIAHEKMSIYAYISVLEVFLKLGIAYLISLSFYDKLIVYAILIFLVQFLVRTCYQVYCMKHYDECRFRLFFDCTLYKDMASFAGWNICGSIAWMLRDQGLNIVLNMFFGPVVNAARGVSSQVSQAVLGFVSNFQIALGPQITKDYAIGNLMDMEKLTYRGTKISVIMLLFLALPLMLNVDYVLHLWLKEVPEYASYFILLIMVDSMANTLFGTPFMTALAATGNIRIYQIVVSISIVMILPVSYIALKLGYDAPCVFYISIIFSFLAGGVRLLFCRKQIGFSIKRFCKDVILPVIGVVVLSIPIPLLIKLFGNFQKSFIELLTLCSISILCVSIFAWLIGFDKNERNAIITIFRKKLFGYA